MADDTYLTKIDEDNGRAFVDIKGDLDTIKVRNTFIAIRFNEHWERGDHSILWRLEKASFPESFEFGDIITTTQLARVVSPPCKSSIILNKNSNMIEMVASFYKSIVSDNVDRKIEIFFNYKDAIAWLNENK
jgi:hypothetical protein